MATQDEIDALSRKKDDELQRASALDDKVRQLDTDSQAQIAKFQQKAQIYQNSGVDGDDEKATEMQRQIDQNRSFTSQESDGLRSQSEQHRANAQQIQADMEQKQAELQQETEQKAREEQEKRDKNKGLAEEVSRHLFF